MRLMDRTRIGLYQLGECLVNTAMTIAVLNDDFGGIVALIFWIPKTAMFGLLSIFCIPVFTPVKDKNALGGLCGAFPGAIPFLWMGVGCNRLILG